MNYHTKKTGKKSKDNKWKNTFTTPIANVINFSQINMERQPPNRKMSKVCVLSARDITRD